MGGKGNIRRDTMDKFEQVKGLTQLAIKTLKIPRKLWTDAEQEAWVAYLSKKNVITELAKWIKKERKHYRARKKIEGFAEQHPSSIEQAKKDLE